MATNKKEKTPTKQQMKDMSREARGRWLRASAQTDKSVKTTRSSVEDRGIAVLTDQENDALHHMLGERLEKFRAKLGVTHDVIGERVGRERTSISNIAQGRQRIPLFQVYQLALALGRKVSELMPTIEEIKARAVSSATLLNDLDKAEFGTDKDPRKATAKTGVKRSKPVKEVGGKLVKDAKRLDQKAVKTAKPPAQLATPASDPVGEKPRKAFKKMLAKIALSRDGKSAQTSAWAGRKSRDTSAATVAVDDLIAEASEAAASDKV